MNDDYYMFFDESIETRTREVHEAERRIEDTGLLGPNGRPIIRIPLPKPTIGFHPPQSEINDGLFDLDPDKVFLYHEVESSTED